MNKKKTFYFFRHGETDWNVQKKFQGHIDVSLNANGQRHAQELAKFLNKVNLELIFSSDLGRAYETAQVVSSELNIPLLGEARLREAHMGDLQGLTRDEVLEKYGENTLNSGLGMEVNRDSWRYPGGESIGEIRERVELLINEISHERSEEVIGMSTHGGLLRRYLNQFISSDEMLSIPNCVVYRLIKKGRNCELEGPLFSPE